jgi:23S rRNA (cytosine1962-C5)-methyltransferase
MVILTPNPWDDYQLIDSGDGERLEKFGQYILRRPDPQIIWKKGLSETEWLKAEAIFKDKNWERNNLPPRWEARYKDIKFYLKLSPFKHTGLFPEQAVHWDFIEDKIKGSNAQPNILNLFGYTGISSMVALKSGARVTHVDASYPTIGWFQDNLKLCGLEDKPIRWIEEDVLKFCERELKRGSRYDGIIMDPPVYGHGPTGEVWDFNKHFPRLMEICSQLLSSNPLFVIINTYAISSSSQTLENVLKDYIKDEGNFEFGELGLKEKSKNRVLSTGIFARWSKK